jgi:hypothetical protein
VLEAVSAAASVEEASALASAVLEAEVDAAALSAAGASVEADASEPELLPQPARIVAAIIMLIMTQEILFVLI